MNNDTKPPSAPQLREPTIQNKEPVPVMPEITRFFQRTDWLSFGLTTVFLLCIYLFSLSPDMPLGLSGTYSVGAMYAGVPHTGGYPLWTLYGWFFTKLVPFSNIAWRLSFSSAVAGALASGLIALLVSRMGSLMTKGVLRQKALRDNDEQLLRVVCGIIAGIAFGCDGGLWFLAVLPDPWPLSMLTMALVLCLLTRWFYQPSRKRYLYLACLIYSMTLTNSFSMATASIGFIFFITLAEPELGRDMLFVITLLLLGSLWVVRSQYWIMFPFGSLIQSRNFYGWLAIATALPCLWLIFRTRRFLTKWKSMLPSGMTLLMGLSLYVYVPIASMTNPPLNWGYPRSAEGFFQVMGRGQYERIQVTGSFAQYGRQILLYGERAVSEFGAIHLLLALIPFCLLQRMHVSERRWLLGSLAIYLCLAFLMLALLNPPLPSGKSVNVFFSASHLILAIWTGCGLLMVGSKVLSTKPSVPTQS